MSRAAAAEGIKREYASLPAAFRGAVSEADYIMLSCDARRDVRRRLKKGDIGDAHAVGVYTRQHAVAAAKATRERRQLERTKRCCPALLPPSAVDPPGTPADQRMEGIINGVQEGCASLDELPRSLRRYLAVLLRTGRLPRVLNFLNKMRDTFAAERLQLFGGLDPDDDDQDTLTDQASTVHVAASPGSSEYR